MNNIVLSAQLKSVKSRADRTWDLTFGTQELTGDGTAQLMGMLMDQVFILINRDTAPEAKDVPEVHPELSIMKTPGQRLRSVLYVYWEHIGSPKTFEAFYLQWMETFIERVKEKLD